MSESAASEVDTNAESDYDSSSSVDSSDDSNPRFLRDEHEARPSCCNVPFRLHMAEQSSRFAITANVTSLRWQYDEVLRLPWDLACLQEVRLTTATQFDMRERLEEDHCQVVFGEPQEERSNPWDCKQGGVAIVARHGLLCNESSPSVRPRKVCWRLSATSVQSYRWLRASRCCT